MVLAPESLASERLFLACAQRPLASKNETFCKLRTRSWCAGDEPPSVIKTGIPNCESVVNDSPKRASSCASLAQVMVAMARPFLSMFPLLLCRHTLQNRAIVPYQQL